ncbi:MAG: hypothetical protein P8L85_20895 [Rubripirellula sp.]|nr:hypothetical protein [Rubripirellula sp.]
MNNRPECMRRHRDASNTIRLASLAATDRRWTKTNADQAATGENEPHRGIACKESAAPQRIARRRCSG